MQQLDKYVVSVLANTDDPTAPGTKVLDNSLIYIMSEIGDCNNHTTATSLNGFLSALSGVFAARVHR